MSNPAPLTHVNRLFRIIVLALDLFVPRFATKEIPCKLVNKDGSPGDIGVLRVSFFNLFGRPVFVRAKVIL